MDTHREPDREVCGALYESHDFLGRPFALRCSKDAWHRRKHSALLPGGRRFRWEGEGPMAGERYPDSRNFTGASA